MVGEDIVLRKQGMEAGAFFIIINPEELDGLSTSVEVGVFSDGKLLETVTTRFLGPS